MKKTSVIVVLSALVLVMSAHYLLSLRVCRSSSGSDFRGGCYLYSNIEQCTGESIGCEDVICEGKNPELPDQHITKIDQIGHYYTSVSHGNEYGRTSYAKVDKLCNYNLTCFQFCEFDSDYTYTCQLLNSSNGEVVKGLVLTGEICGNGP